MTPRYSEQAALDRFSAEGAPDFALREDEKDHAARRARDIRRILDARFSLGALEELKDRHPDEWRLKRNDMARGFYGEALRECQRLQSATDAELHAELAALTP